MTMYVSSRLTQNVEMFLQTLSAQSVCASLKMGCKAKVADLIEVIIFPFLRLSLHWSPKFVGTYQTKNRQNV